MWASWRLQESTWVNALVRDGELECPDSNCKFSIVFLLFTENLSDRVRFRESTAIILGNALGLSDTVPGALFGLVYHYLQAGSIRSIHLRTMDTSGPLLEEQLKVIYKRGCNKFILWLQTT